MRKRLRKENTKLFLNKSMTLRSDHEWGFHNKDADRYYLMVWTLLKIEVQAMVLIWAKKTIKWVGKKWCHRWFQLWQDSQLDDIGNFSRQTEEYITQADTMNRLGIFHVWEANVLERVIYFIKFLFNMHL